ncbi:hypothetical protein MHBO_000275 [Bonamia ostreae]|uniref:Uncharacterized protein n=1 Tax=Bonamia ostreae TaxID=126728 RepID=A0ABV2AF28_9EUKA
MGNLIKFCLFLVTINCLCDISSIITDGTETSGRDMNLSINVHKIAEDRQVLILCLDPSMNFVISDDNDELMYFKGEVLIKCVDEQIFFVDFLERNDRKIKNVKCVNDLEPFIGKQEIKDQCVSKAIESRIVLSSSLETDLFYNSGLRLTGRCWLDNQTLPKYIQIKCQNGRYIYSGERGLIDNVFRYCTCF